MRCVLPCGRQATAAETAAGAVRVVSLHRFENIFKRERLLKFLNLIEEAAKWHPLVFVLHPATRQNLEKFGLFDRLAENERHPALAADGLF